MSTNDAFADANRVRLAYIEEIDFGVTPDLPAMQIMRITSSDLSATKETSASDEIRSDRQVSDLAELAFTSGGSFGFEESMLTFDELLEGTIANRWVDTAQIIGDFDISINDPAVGRVTITDPNLTGVLAALVAGNQLYINWGTDRGWFEIVLVQSADVIIINDPLGQLIDATAYPLTMGNDSLVNGVEKISYSIEQSFLDVGVYQLYQGQRVGTWSLEIASQSKITGSFAFQGTSVLTNVIEYGDSYIPATTTPIVNATSNVGYVLVNGVMLDTCIQSISIELDNALRVQAGVGSKFPCGIGYGRVNITGNLTAYFVNTTLYNIFLNHTDASIVIPLVDTEGNSLLIELPKVKFSSDSPAPSGIDTDVMDEIDFQAIVGPGGYTIKLSRASVASLITEQNGTLTRPATIMLFDDNYLTGSTFSIEVRPSGSGGTPQTASITLASDSTGEEVALLWATEIATLTDVEANSAAKQINVLPGGAETMVYIDLLKVVPA